MYVPLLEEIIGATGNYGLLHNSLHNAKSIASVLLTANTIRIGANKYYAFMHIMAYS